MRIIAACASGLLIAGCFNDQPPRPSPVWAKNSCEVKDSFNEDTIIIKNRTSTNISTGPYLGPGSTIVRKPCTPEAKVPDMSQQRSLCNASAFSGPFILLDFANNKEITDYMDRICRKEKSASQAMRTSMKNPRRPESVKAFRKYWKLALQEQECRRNLLLRVFCGIP